MLAARFVRSADVLDWLGCPYGNIQVIALRYPGDCSRTGMRKRKLGLDKSEQLLYPVPDRLKEQHFMGDS